MGRNRRIGGSSARVKKRGSGMAKARKIVVITISFLVVACVGGSIFLTSMPLLAVADVGPRDSMSGRADGITRAE